MGCQSGAVHVISEVLGSNSWLHPELSWSDREGESLWQPRLSLLAAVSSYITLIEQYCLYRFHLRSCPHHFWTISKLSWCQKNNYTFCLGEGRGWNFHDVMFDQSPKFHQQFQRLFPNNRRLRPSVPPLGSVPELWAELECFTIRWHPLGSYSWSIKVLAINPYILGTHAYLVHTMGDFKVGVNTGV
jgi:hypothetical protein